MSWQATRTPLSGSSFFLADVFEEGVHFLPLLIGKDMMRLFLATSRVALILTSTISNRLYLVWTGLERLGKLQSFRLPSDTNPGSGCCSLASS